MSTILSPAVIAVADQHLAEVDKVVDFHVNLARLGLAVGMDKADLTLTLEEAVMGTPKERIVPVMVGAILRLAEIGRAAR